MKQFPEISGMQFHRQSLNIPILLFFLCLLLVSLVPAVSARPFVIPTSAWYDNCGSPAPTCSNGGEPSMLSVTLSQPYPSSISTTGQTTIPVNVKIQSVDGMGNCQGALV